MQNYLCTHTHPKKEDKHVHANHAYKLRVQSSKWTLALACLQRCHGKQRKGGDWRNVELSPNIRVLSYINLCKELMGAAVATSQAHVFHRLHGWDDTL